MVFPDLRMNTQPLAPVFPPLAAPQALPTHSPTKAPTYFKMEQNHGRLDCALFLSIELNVLAPRKAPFPPTDRRRPLRPGPHWATLAMDYQFPGRLRDPRSANNQNSEPSSKVTGVEEVEGGEPRRAWRRSLSLYCNPPGADPTLQGGRALPGLRSPTPQREGSAWPQVDSRP